MVAGREHFVEVGIDYFQRQESQTLVSLLVRWGPGMYFLKLMSRTVDGCLFGKGQIANGHVD